MGFITWVIHRGKTPQQPVAEKPQERPRHAKDWHAEKAALEEASRNPITREIKADARDAVSAMKRPSEALLNSVKPPAPESGGNPSAHLQKQDRQEKAQAALSPTDGSKGKSASEEKPKTPEKKTERPRTLPRTPPSWER